MERLFLLGGKVLMGVGLLAGAYALYVGITGPEVGMGAMAQEFKAITAALGFFAAGFFFARAGTPQEDGPEEDGPP